MNPLVTGNFQQADDVRLALVALAGAGFSRGQIASFPYAGLLPLTEAPLEVPGADPAIGGAMSGAAVGGAVGIVVGLASLPLLGPAATVAGVGAGAYVGSLVGALSRLGDPEHPDLRPDPATVPVTEPPRQTGTVVAIEVLEPGRRAAAIEVLREHGATDIEVPDGTIVDGRWTDFDARLPLRLLTP